MSRTSARKISRLRPNSVQARRRLSAARRACQPGRHMGAIGYHHGYRQVVSLRDTQGWPPTVYFVQIGFMPEASPRITQLARELREGKVDHVDELVPLLYSELRRLAASYLRRERPGHTLQPTALVNEAYLRLVDQKEASWDSRVHFIGIAARVMRQVLVDHARRRGAQRRGGAQPKLTLDEAIAYSHEQPGDLLAVDELLNRMATFDPQQARVVELRVFGGLTVEETAEALGISPATVKRDWVAAKAWLTRELRRQ
jgi:RNA polymerase sigma-70 factor (ECF subfamily)